MPDLRLAADRYQRRKAGPIFGEAKAHRTARQLEDASTLADAYLDGPRWHDKPPVPGRYVVRKATDDVESGGCVTVDEIDGWVKAFPDRRWFGPIPPDPEAP